MRQTDCAVEITADRFRLTTGSARVEISFTDIAWLQWGGVGEYARIRIVTFDGCEHSLLAGLARVPKERAALLPPLQDEMKRRLEMAGLEEVPHKRSRKLQEYVRSV